MAYISDQSDKALADLNILGSQTLDQVQEKTLEKLDQLTLMSDEFKEKFGFLEQDQNDFLSRINAKINLKTKDMDNQLSLWFQDFNRLEQLFQESITRSDKITGILDFEHGRILTEFEQEKAGLHSLAEEFAGKYRKLEEKHYMRDREISESVKDMSTHMAYISEQAQKVFQDTWNQAARVSDEEKYRIKKELDRLSLTIDEFKERFHELEDDLHTSQTIIKAKLDRKVGFFSKGLKELLGKAHQEIAKLSEKSCKEQVTSFIEEQKKELPDFEKQLKDFEKQIWENQENFQKKAGQAIVKKLLQESSHIKQEFDKKIEQEIAALKQEQENSDTDQRKREADIRSVLQKIYQGQKKHTAALVKMEKQINILGSRSQPQKKPD
ncbi:Uncharacterized protein dnl_11190 [Desulfonema limicola]|uniref:Uncharacterized protein n=1 Tax=Desulfonema limicola TaxID=45656 RepID=A0A975B4Y7_9BACT|nr:hypothetical protein [Desulfonema limicola]QTA78875.1 Uncharacterized protein dnl_11190 [Desulfonema limicola]